MKLEEVIKTDRFESPHHRAALNIIYTRSWLSEKMNAVIKPFDISEEQYNVLRILKGQKGRPANLMDIHERMLHKTSNTTRLVEKLRQKGLVERSLCEQNRRKVEILITKEGLELLKELSPLLQQGETKMSKALTKAEASQLGELLDKFRG